VDPSDSELVERYRRGDAQAFETLVKRYQRRVFALAFGIVHDTEDAHDIGQEAFIKVHRYIDRFEGSASFYTWLYRIVVNLAIDHLRRHCKAPMVEYDDSLDRSDASGASAPIFPNRLGGSPAEALQNQELRDQIRLGLEQLSPNHRAVLILREVEGLSYSDMSKVMRCSKGTIMSRLFHARKRMQAFLQKYLNEGRNTGV
jgi:RNA polymerase sigma-70 factor (ECF subfamily)